MTFRYTTAWANIELVAAFAITLGLYEGLHPLWWGWLLYAPLFLYLVLESVFKLTYSLTVDGDRITVGNFKPGHYSVSDITALNVCEVKGARIAVVAFADGSRFNFPSHLEGFDDLVGLLRTRARLQPPVDQGGQWKSV